LDLSKGSFPFVGESHQVSSGWCHVISRSCFADGLEGFEIRR
jgi:hypothetical protein